MVLVSRTVANVSVWEGEVGNRSQIGTDGFRASSIGLKSVLDRALAVLRFPSDSKVQRSFVRPLVVSAEGHVRTRGMNWPGACISRGAGELI